jgi:hypothetical protein
MPRFVRPAFLTVRVPGRQTKTMSPLSSTGHIDADLTVRTPIGAVSRPINIMAGGYNHHGDVDVTISVPRGFAVTTIETGDGTSINIMPTNEA